MEILKWLENSPAVKKYTIQEYKTFPDGFYIKIKIILINETELFTREYSDLNERNYSYHWQDKKGNLIIRWDNAPHHPELFNAPHHKHFSEKMEPSEEVTLLDILKIIQKSVDKK